MPIVMTENFDSREWVTTNVQEHTRFYTLQGSSDDQAIRTHVEANTPTAVDLTVRQSIGVRAEWADDVNDDGLWRAVVEYGPLDLLGLGTSILSFDTSGGTQHVTQSLKTISRTGQGTTPAPDYKGTIGVGRDGSVAGIDLVVPVFNFAETHYLADTTVDAAYKLTLFSLTGRVNDNPFKDFAAGEVLFFGVQGVKRSNALWELIYRFGALPNRTDIILGGPEASKKITVAAKWGWEHLWVAYQETSEGTGDSLNTIITPKAAYVEKVYEVGNMADLGIGV